MRYFRVYSYFAYCPNVLIVMCFFPVVFSLNIVVYVAFSHCVSLISFSLDQFLSLFFFFFFLTFITVIYLKSTRILWFLSV